MAKRRISMFEAFGAASSKGAQGPQVPQRSETQRAIDAQRGLDPRESGTPSAEVLRAMRAQLEAELAAARRAPRAAFEGSAQVADSAQASVEPCEPGESASGGTAQDDLALAEARAAQAGQAQMFQQATPAQRAMLYEAGPTAHAGSPAGGTEGAFVLPCGRVGFIGLQLGLFAVAFGLGALTAGGVGAGPRDTAGRGPVADEQSDLALGLGEQIPGNSPGNAAASRAERPARPPADPLGVRGGKPAATAGDQGQPRAANGAHDPHLTAFLDPENHFSLQVASYDGSPNGQGMARHWQGYLRERQFAAVLRQVGTRLALFVGASPNSLEIEELQRRLLELRDERGARIFSGPRVVNLKDYR